MIGLRQLLVLRGGVDALGWTALMKPNIVALEAFWTYLRCQPHLVSSQEVKAPPAPASAFARSGSTPSRAEMSNSSTAIPIGFRLLAKSQRLSKETILIIDQLAHIYSTLQHTSPSFLNHGGGIRKFTKSKNDTGRETTLATILLICEHLALQLARHDLNSIDRACCISLFVLLLGSTRGEQLSPIYLIQVQHHARELLQMSFDESDTAAVHLLTWAILNVASTTFPPKSLILPKDDDPDPRYALAKKAVSHYPASQTWDEMSEIVRHFFWNPSCLDQWKYVWNLGTRQHQSQHLSNR